MTKREKIQEQFDAICASKKWNLPKRFISKFAEDVDNDFSEELEDFRDQALKYEKDLERAYHAMSVGLSEYAKGARNTTPKEDKPEAITVVPALSDEDRELLEYVRADKFNKSIELKRLEIISKASGLDGKKMEAFEEYMSGITPNVEEESELAAKKYVANFTKVWVKSVDDAGVGVGVGGGGKAADADFVEKLGKINLTNLKI